MANIVPAQNYEWLDLTSAQQLRVSADLGDQGRVFVYADRTQTALRSSWLVKPSETIAIPSGGLVSSALITCSHGSLEYEPLNAAGRPDYGVQSEIVRVTESRNARSDDNGKTLVFTGPWTYTLVADLDSGWSTAMLPPPIGTLTISAGPGVVMNNVLAPTSVTRTGMNALFATVAVAANAYIITGS